MRRDIAESDKLAADQHKLTAEQQKLTAEQLKFGAEQLKLAQEAAKLGADRKLAPFINLGSLTVGLGGVLVALASLILRAR